MKEEIRSQLERELEEEVKKYLARSIRDGLENMADLVANDKADVSLAIRSLQATLHIAQKVGIPFDKIYWSVIYFLESVRKRVIEYEKSRGG